MTQAKHTAAPWIFNQYAHDDETVQKMLSLGIEPTFAQSNSGGMSLRDYFAAAALQGLLANHKVVNISEDEKQNYIQIGSEIDEVVSAETSYRMADAMLAERLKARQS